MLLKKKNTITEEQNSLEMPQLFRIIFLQIIGSKIQKLRKAAHRGDHVIILYCQTYLIHMSK
jgi:hypothetical protein